MANFATLLQTIAGNIYTNGEGDINAEVLKSVLNAMVEGLGQAGYIFKGVAQPSTSPGTPDTNVFYLAGVGTFTNFGGTTVDKGHIGIFAYDGSWNYQVLTTGAWFESEVYPNDDALEVTFYDSDDDPDGVTIKINADVSEFANSRLEAISQWWAAKKERRINVISGYDIEFEKPLTTSWQTLGMFEYIEPGQIIDSINGVEQLIFGSDGGFTVTVNASDCPYKATTTLVNVKTASGTANNVSIKVRAIDELWPTYININEIANHPGAYADAATALADVPELYRRKGVKVVYYDDDSQLWIEMLCVDNSGPNWWTDVENNWIIEGPIETKVFSSTGGQQLSIAGEKRSNLDDVLNVNVWNDKNFAYDSAELARAAVPFSKRKLGAIITYWLDDSWITEQFLGVDIDGRINNWEVSTNWQTLGPAELTQLAGDVKDTTEKAGAASLSELNARLLALEKIVSATITNKLEVTKEFNVWGKTNLILAGSGAATFAPDFIGQKYIDTTGGNVYVAIGTSTADNWKLV